MIAEDVWGTVVARERGLLPEQIEADRFRAALRKIVSEYDEMAQEPLGAGVNAQFLAHIARLALEE